MRKLLNRKVRQQAGICAICHEEFTEYDDIVPDHKNPKEWAELGDTTIQIMCKQPWWCNGEKGSTWIDD
jgi:hypothetical protein